MEFLIYHKFQNSKYFELYNQMRLADFLLQKSNPTRIEIDLL